MARIDEATVRRINDAADIVEVVSDYVRLKKRGSGYIGLCPFHNERTPSFSVSKSRNICKCFSCGKGGSPVGFIMEIEQVDYPGALRILARKYGIAIEERELTDEERREASERESMLAVNEFAMRWFERNLQRTQEGRDVGLAYFRHRGISDRMIERFHLGYSLEKRDALRQEALRAGFTDEFLEKTGLIMRHEGGDISDRFRARVIYPIFTLSGKVVGFGGRTLRTDKKMAKYVNSPESVIYHKSTELYGLHQAKPSIVRKDKCILVEGYMDVISMHQAGIENVVASSGTSLTEGQIRLIHRFTENVTVIYDSDPAGIKASLRSIDMLLSEGMNVKMLSLPDGDDPDSFAQSHSASEVEAYLNEHEVDFIRFKTDILMRDASPSDPQQRANLVQDILRSISVIPDSIVRQAYIQETARQFDMPDTVLALRIDKLRADGEVEKARQAAQQKSRDEFEERRKAEEDALAARSLAEATAAPSADAQTASTDTDTRAHKRREYYCFKPERALLTLVLRYGMLHLCEVYDQEGNALPMKVIEYVRDEFNYDGFGFETPAFRATWEAALEIFESPQRLSDQQSFMDAAKERMNARMQQGIEDIRRSANDIDDIHRLEISLREQCEADYRKEVEDFEADYISKALINSPDDTLRRVTSDLVCERYSLSKIHSKYAPVPGDRERLPELVPGAVSSLKNAILECEYDTIREKLAAASDSPEEYLPLMTRQQQLKQMIKEMAHYLGDRIIPPRYKF